MADLDLKPRTVGELLDAAFCLYRRRFPRLALTAILISAPAVVVAAIYARDAAAALRDFTSTTQDATRANGDDPFKMLSQVSSAWGRLLPTSILALALQAFARAAAALAMAPVALAAVRRTAVPGLGEIARVTAARLLPAFALQIVFDIAWSGMSCCCPPVGLLTAVVLAPTAAILVVERGPLETRLRAAMPAVAAAPFVPFAACADAVARGARLSWSGPVFGRAVALFTVLLMFVWIFDSAVTLPVAEFTKDTGHWFWVQHCAEMMFLPVVGLGRALWYFDLVARREGADLEPAA